MEKCTLQSSYCEEHILRPICTRFLFLVTESNFSFKIVWGNCAWPDQISNLNKQSSNIWFHNDTACMETHHNLYITLLLQAKTKIMLAKQFFCVVWSFVVIFLYNVFIFVWLQLKCIHYRENGHFVFQYNLYFFVWMQHFWCLSLNCLISKTVL